MKSDQKNTNNIQQYYLKQKKYQELEGSNRSTNHRTQIGNLP